MDELHGEDKLNQVQIDKSIFRVHIDDKVDKIKTYLKMSGTNVSNDIVSMGKVITKPE